MVEPVFLEEDLANSNKDRNKSNSSKRPLSKFTFLAIALSVGLIALGVYWAASGTLISADVEPPKPDDPISRVLPPTPEVPTRIGEFPPVPPAPNEFVFEPGWSMVSGKELYGYDLTNFRNAGLALYSFNDPKYANRDWAVVYGDENQCQEEKIGCNVIVPQPPIGYYVYNPENGEKHVTLQPTQALDLSNNIFGRGWHIMYWGGDAIKTQDLLNRISITYSDGKTLTAKESISDSEHRVSLKIYGVVDEKTIDMSKALKEFSLSGGSGDMTTIPAKSYFWLYLRRTTKRVTAMSINDDYTTPVKDEKILIDTWLKANNLTECGDPEGTMYTGGSCLFDESTGQYRDKYELIKKKFPEKPWVK